ncbi:TPM domain-containing protein [uncultured Moraxella sp.]|uniref:TPM domain-containing protein n=1 Tax=uncultured Moraxella sp. TaxID=263769 RepID=UPI0025EE3DF0|nr:TPM domain-containing protein [uncultured Moraxella sp.]
MAILKNPKQSSKVVAAILSLAMLCLPVNTLASQANSQLATATLSSQEIQTAERADGITQAAQSSTPANQLILDTPVIDEVGLLSTQQNQALSERLRQIHQQGKAQIAIVIVPSTDGEPIFDYAMQVADRWGLGNKDTDNGLLIVVAVNDRKMQILTGHGLEGIIPDAIAKRIIREEMTPAFKDGRYADGLMQAVDAIDSRLQADPETLARMNDAELTGDSGIGIDTIVLLIIAFVFGKILAQLLGRLLGSAVAAIGFGALAIMSGTNPWTAFCLAVFICAYLAILQTVIDLRTALRLDRISSQNHRNGGRSGRSSGGFGGSSGGFGGGGYRGGGGSFGGGGAGGSW